MHQNIWFEKNIFFIKKIFSFSMRNIIELKKSRCELNVYNRVNVFLSVQMEHISIFAVTNIENIFSLIV
jgi:hypothetical protein